MKIDSIIDIWTVTSAEYPILFAKWLVEEYNAVVGWIACCDMTDEQQEEHMAAAIKQVEEWIEKNGS